MSDEQPFRWLPRSVHETVPYVVLLVLCGCCFISPPMWLLQHEQGLKSSLITAAGLVSWLSILFYPAYFWPKHLPAGMLLLGALAAALLADTLLGPQHAAILLGTAVDRIGALFLLSAIGMGLAIRKLERDVLVGSLYVTTLLLAAVSVLYNLLFLGSLVRLAGPLRQADVLAAWLGCGFLLGLSLYHRLPRYRVFIIAGQTLLLVTLLLTGTRAVIGIVPLLSVVYVWRYGKSQQALAAVVVAACLLILVLFAGPGGTALLGQDAQLRLHVQAAALHAISGMPLSGYGPGTIANIIPCQRFTSPDLLHVCSLHLVFTSTHNIYLDRLLAFGWLVWIPLLSVLCYGLWRGYRSRDPAILALAAAVSLISLYYLTNVTSPELELLDWMLLICILFSDSPRMSSTR